MLFNNYRPVSLLCVLSKVFYRGKDVNAMAQEINIELSQISLWLKTNKLSLNIKKTHFMLFHRKIIDAVIKIQIDNEEIDRVYKTKFLCVIIDHKITWKEHVTYVSGKMTRSIGILIKTCHDDFVLLIYIPLYDLLQ